MTPLSRRAFFQMLGGSAAGHTPGPVPSPIMEIDIGSVSRFPPGETCEFELKEGTLRVVSSPRGIRAELEAGEKKSAVRLELSGNGKVIAKLNQKCEAKLVLLHLTGETALEE